MPSLLPTVGEYFQSKLTPEYFKTISREHETGRLTKKTEELREITREALVAQNKIALALAQSQLAASQVNGETTALLQRVSIDIGDILATLQTFAATTDRRLQDINTNLGVGFNLVIGRLEAVIEGQASQAELLKDIGALLASPAATRVRELKLHADEQLERTLRNPSRNREANLTTCLDLYKTIVSDPIGGLDYDAWFQIGWVNWQRRDSLKRAIEAFSNAQRLSEGKDGHGAFRVQCFRHIADAYFLQGSSSAAVEAIVQAIELSGPDVKADTLIEAARYWASQDNQDEATLALGSALSKEPTLFVLAATDPDLDFAWVKEFLLATEQTALKESRALHQQATILVKLTLPIGQQVASAETQNIQRALEGTAELLDSGTASYVTSRHVAIEATRAQERYIEVAKGALSRLRNELSATLKRVQDERESLPRAAQQEQASLIAQWEAQDKLAAERTQVRLKKPDEFTPLSSLPGGVIAIGFGILFVVVLTKIRPTVNDWWPALFLAGLISTAIVKVSEWVLQVVYGLTKYNPHAEKMYREREQLQEKSKAVFGPKVSAVDGKLEARLRHRQETEIDARSDAEIAERWTAAFDQAISGNLRDPVPPQPLLRRLWGINSVSFSSIQADLGLRGR